MTLEEQKIEIIERAFADELEKLGGWFNSTPESPSLLMRTKAFVSKTGRESRKANKQLLLKFKEAGTKGFKGSFTEFRDLTENSRNAYNNAKHQEAVEWANKSYRDPNFLDLLKKHKVGLGIAGVGALGLMAYSASKRQDEPLPPEMPAV